MNPQTAARQRIAALAQDLQVHAAFRHFHLHEQRLHDWQTTFLAIPAPPFAESARALWFLDHFRQLGLTNPHIDAAGNALAELPAPDATADSPVLLLAAHLDTVFPATTPITPVIDADSRILCPGAADNGAGLTALLAIAAAMQAAAITPPCTLLFAANVGEEGEGDLRGVRHLFTDSPYAPRIRTMLALEGAGSAIVVDRALGARRLRVTVTGPGGHSWADAHTPNPVVALAAMLLEAANIPLPATPRTTFKIGTVAAGTSVNSVPATATADLDLRSVSADTLDQLEAAVLAALHNPRHLPADLRLTITRIGSRPSGALPPDSPLAVSLAAVDRHLSLSTDARIGSTDANIPLSLGVPALAISAGGTAGGIHTTAEWFDPRGRDLALRRILLLLLDAAAQVHSQT